MKNIASMAGLIRFNDDSW